MCARAGQRRSRYWRAGSPWWLPDWNWSLASSPVLVRGINSDNDSVFINERLLSYCEDRGIEFTRSRAYRKNDQAWIEQKNCSAIRRFVGHERYSDPMAGQTMAHLYGAMRLYVNHFQP